MPPFTPPDFSLFFDVLPDAVIISLVAFASSISVADLYARKYKYKIESNQEDLWALPTYAVHFLRVLRPVVLWQEPVVKLTYFMN